MNCTLWRNIFSLIFVVAFIYESLYGKGVGSWRDFFIGAAVCFAIYTFISTAKNPDKPSVVKMRRFLGGLGRNVFITLFFLPFAAASFYYGGFTWLVAAIVGYGIGQYICHRWLKF